MTRLEALRALVAQLEAKGEYPDPPTYTQCADEKKLSLKLTKMRLLKLLRVNE
jgi:hypothetical protein